MRSQFLFSNGIEASKCSMQLKGGLGSFSWFIYGIWIYLIMLEDTFLHFLAPYQEAYSSFNSEFSFEIADPFVPLLSK